MAEHWHRTSDLVDVPGMPNSCRAIRARALRNGWEYRRRGNRYEWAESSFPPEIQEYLAGWRGRVRRRRELRNLEPFVLPADMETYGMSAFVFGNRAHARTVALHFMCEAARALNLEFDPDDANREAYSSLSDAMRTLTVPLR